MILCRSRDDQLKRAITGANWNFQNAETGYLTHAVHRYSGKFIPQIAGKAVELLTRPGDLVVDPYCGSGTTLVESAVRGRRALGIDMNPLAVLIATVKCAPVEQTALTLFGDRLGRVVGRLEQDGFFREPPLRRDLDDPRLQDPWFNKWFQPHVLQDLVALYNAISDEVDIRLRNIGLVAFSDILRRSSNAHQGYPNVMFDKGGGVRPRPGRFFLKSMRQIISAVGSLPRAAAWQDVRAEEGDARALCLPVDCADAVITHPPYVASIPYAEYGALSLRWLGYDPKGLDRRLTGGLRQSKDVLRRFSEDYLAMFMEVRRVAKPGGYLFTMVGNPMIKGERIDLSDMTRAHAEAVGFVLVAATTRTGENRRANKMGQETLLVFRKP